MRKAHPALPISPRAYSPAWSTARLKDCQECGRFLGLETHLFTGETVELADPLKGGEKSSGQATQAILI